MPDSDPPDSDAVTPVDNPKKRVYSNSLAPVGRIVGQAMTLRTLALVGVAVAIAATLPGTLEEVADPLLRVGAALVAVVVIIVASRLLRNGS